MLTIKSIHVINVPSIDIRFYKTKKKNKKINQIKLQEIGPRYKIFSCLV